MIFLADTTCILALYMITQTMTHVLGQLVPLYSAGIVIYRRFCRVSRCFHKYSVTCENLNTCAHLNPPHTPRPPHTVLPRFRRPIEPLNSWHLRENACDERRDEVCSLKKTHKYIPMSQTAIFSSVQASAVRPNGCTRTCRTRFTNGFRGFHARSPRHHSCC